MRWRLLAVLVKILTDTAAATNVEGVWPNVVEQYTHDDSEGLLPETQAVDRDYRHYYQLVAAELLLVHHGFLECEARGYTTRVDKTKKAIEDFQRNLGLPPDAFGLETLFWSALVVSVYPGDENSAVLALKWLVDSRHEPSRSPSWDAIQVDEQGCTAYFDDSLLHKLAHAATSLGQPFAGSITPSIWQALLNAEEVRGTGGCNYRAFVAHTFGVAWVVVWVTMGLGFTVLHNDSPGQGSKMQAAVLPLKVLDRLPVAVRRMLILIAFAVCHTLAIVGIWSFPLDFVADLLTGCYWTIASLVTVRLAAPGSASSSRPYYVRAVEVTGFIYVNMALYFLYVAFPQEEMWRLFLLFVFTVFASIATVFSSEGSCRLRLARGGLLLVMSTVSHVLPTMLMLLINTIDSDGVVLMTIMPSLLQPVLLVSECLVGRLLEKYCEYTEEAKWLLALLFRFYIELVRFQSAMALLLLSSVTGWNFLYLAVHLVQSFLHDIMMRVPCEAQMAMWESWKKASRERADSTEQSSVEDFEEESDWLPPTAPFEEPQERLRALTWASRSQAMLLPTEVAILISHLSQLTFMGMPVGISGWIWMLGLFCVACVSGLREVLAKVMARRSWQATPEIPWPHLRGHTVALVFSAGLVTSTLVQVRFSWILYAHHWGSCFMSLPNDDRVSTPQDTEVLGVVFMASVAALMLGVVMSSFFLWFDWAMRAEQHLDLSPKSPSSSVQVVRLQQQSQSLRVEAEEASKVPPQRSEDESGMPLARTWERTLNSLWAETEKAETAAGASKLPQPPQPPEARGRALVTYPARDEEHFAPKDVDVDVGIAALLHEVAPEAEEELKAVKAMGDLDGEPKSTSEASLLQDVLADLPDATDFDDDVETKRLKSAQIERLLVSGVRENEAGWSINDADVSALLDPAHASLRTAARNDFHDAEAVPSFEALGELLAEDMDIDRLVANIDLQDDAALDAIIEDEPTPLGGGSHKALLQENVTAYELDNPGAKHDTTEEEAKRRQEVEEAWRKAEEEEMARHLKVSANPQEEAEAGDRQQSEHVAEAEAAGADQALLQDAPEEEVKWQQDDAEAGLMTEAADRNAAQQTEEARRKAEEEVEEARRKAEEDAEEARRKAEEEVEEARRKAEEEAEVARRKAEEAEEARRKAEEEAEEARRKAEEEETARRLAEEARLKAEEEARIAAEKERLRTEAAQALSSAIEARDKQQLQERISEAEAAGVAQETLSAAGQVLQDIIEEEKRRQAELALAHACEGTSVEALQLAISAARSVGASEAAIDTGTARLEELLEAIRRREAAEQKLQALLALAAADTSEALATQIDELIAAISEAVSAGVEDGLETAKECLSSLQLHKLREDAKQAMRAALATALATNDIQQVLASIEEAKSAGVDKDEIAHVERVLEEKAAAEKILLTDIEKASAQHPTTQLVVEGLREAIARAQGFSADTQAAEKVLSELVAENERQTKAALHQLEESVSGQALLPEPISKAVAVCRSLMLDDALTSAFTKLHDWCEHELQLGQSGSTKAERMVVVGKVEAIIAVMRENGAKNLRKLHNDMQDLKGALRVFCRVRPLSKAEAKKGDVVGVDILDHFTVQVQQHHHQESTGAFPHFSYDAIFGPESSQTEVYTECRSLLQSCFDGYNITIFSYGQTGAGKTWTLYGTGSEPGISPRTCKEVFLLVGREEEKCNIEVQASMVELYLNDLRDLLTSSKSPPKLEFKSYKRPDGSTGTQLDGITYVRCEKSEDLAKAVAQGLGNRKTRRTNMNADSSRSHLLLTIRLSITDKLTGRQREGKITIVDLAGSERLAKSGVTGEGQQEAIQINKSLTALGDVMMAFTSGAKVIPYRNHKLTQLMQDSLGGNAKTLMFVNVSPAASNADETINALKYASRARCIENDFRKNVVEK